MFKNDDFIKYSNFRAKFAKKYFLSSINKLEGYKKNYLILESSNNFLNTGIINY